MVAKDGGIFAFDAPFDGSMGGLHLNAPIVGMAALPNGGGYWLVGADGGIFAFGAPFDGSMGGKALDAPIVGITATSDGGGYWFVGADAGIFNFGDAAYDGSMGGKALNAPIVGMDTNGSSGGYWLVGSDGGIFAFGTPFYGSMGGLTLQKPMVGIAYDGYEGGYWTVAADGGVFAFVAPFLGSIAGSANPYPVPAPLNPQASQAGPCIQGGACSINVLWGIPASPYLSITGFALSWAPPGGSETSLGVVSGTSTEDSYSIQNAVPGTYTIYIQTVAGSYGSSVAVTVTIAPVGTVGGGGCVVTSSGYINPFCHVSNLVAERIDQGVDFSGTGPIVAIGSGRVTNYTIWLAGEEHRLRINCPVDRPPEMLFMLPRISVAPFLWVIRCRPVKYWEQCTMDRMELRLDGGTKCVGCQPWSSQWNSSSDSTAYGLNFSQFLGSIGLLKAFSIRQCRALYPSVGRSGSLTTAMPTIMTWAGTTR